MSTLASPLKMTFPAATKHVRVLERAKLVRRRVIGREHVCRLVAEPLKDAMAWTEQFRRNWEARFVALDALLDEMKAEEAEEGAGGLAKRARATRRHGSGTKTPRARRRSS